MSTKAIVRDDWERDGVKVAIIRDRGGRRELLTWSLGEVRVLEEADRARPEEDPESFLHLADDDARALYEALGDHFGHAGHDVRALRKDYDAERKRVDLLIDKVTR